MVSRKRDGQFINDPSRSLPAGRQVTLKFLIFNFYLCAAWLMI
jgi:hypothetical protein